MLIAHLADHWLVYLLYALPMIIVFAAIVTSVLRERARDEAQARAEVSPAGRGDDDRESP